MAHLPYRGNRMDEKIDELFLKKCLQFGPKGVRLSILPLREKQFPKRGTSAPGINQGVENNKYNTGEGEHQGNIGEGHSTSNSAGGRVGTGDQYFSKEELKDRRKNKDGSTDPHDEKPSIKNV